MGNTSTTITTPTVVRQTKEPQALDGRIWINPKGGNSSNNTERYIYNADVKAWELDTAIGKDTPTKQIDGSIWQDTSVDPTTTRVYDGGTSSWEKLGLESGHINPTYDSNEDGKISHQDLSNINSSNHHSKASGSIDSGTVTVAKNNSVAINQVTVSHNLNTSPRHVTAGTKEGSGTIWDEYTGVYGVHSVNSSNFTIEYISTISDIIIKWYAFGVS
jgi:hypothetical protein